MADVKNVISVLCKHLNFLFNIELKPEYFRLAKFNKSEDNIVPIFWNLLSKFPDKIATSNIVRNTKLYLAKNKYQSIEFFGLTENMSDGSRELLLALGFLISTGSLHNIVNKEIRNCPFDPSYSPVLRNGNFSKQYNMEDFKISTKNDLKNVTQWIDGKIKFSERMVFDYEIQLKKLETKVCIY